MSYDHELEAALAAAREASDVLLDMYVKFRAIPDAPMNISLDADRRSQEVILHHLVQCFPGDAYSAEESSDFLGHLPHTGPRLWVVDPIDGTRGFADKSGEFSVMIAFVDNGRVAAGVVAEPERDRQTYASLGGGCYIQRGKDQAVRCRVTECSDLHEATLVQTRSRAGAGPSRAYRAIQPRRVIETYSAGVKLAIVARGEGDVYVNSYGSFHDWDICAGHILVEEAGGTVSGLSGQPLRYGEVGAKQTEGLLASNGRLHVDAVAAWRERANA